jgi:hypothetical protein
MDIWVGPFSNPLLPEFSQSCTASVPLQIARAGLIHKVLSCKQPTAAFMARPFRVEAIVMELYLRLRLLAF